MKNNLFGFKELKSLIKAENRMSRKSIKTNFRNYYNEKYKPEVHLKTRLQLHNDMFHLISFVGTKLFARKIIY